MKQFHEGDLIFNVTDFKSREHFDDDNIIGTLPTIKRVDFIFEDDNKFIFVEVKDPDDPDASNVAKFIGEFQDGSLFCDLASKYRDTLFFTSLRQEYTKPISYIILIAMESMDAGMLLGGTEKLKGALPVSHPKWSKESVESCIMLNLEGFNEHFGSELAWRHSEYDK